MMPASSASAVVSGQVDTFEDGTTQGWVVALLGAPHPAPPTNVASGGPAGSDDNYLLVTAVGGAGAGSKLSVINPAQWTGNFIMAGIGFIEMDLNNFGPSDLSLRVLFEDPMGGPPANIAFSSDAIVLPAGSGWTSVIFPVSLADLTAGQGDGAAALMNTTAMRIFHNPLPASPGPAVEALLGIDNIEALPPIPAPSALVLASLGVLTLLSRGRRGKR